jgi:SAM-dependent methyltransferase
MDYWNHNVAHHPVILRAVPDDCAEALDVGCGDGLLVRKLAARAARVTGIDPSPEMIALARERGGGLANAAFREEDFLSADLAAGGYDFVCSVAVIHHMDFTAALTRMRELLRPGGTLAVVSLARNASARDWAFEIISVPVARANRLRRNHGGPEGMPIADAEMSWREVRDQARRLLPGVRYRRHALWRYSLVWRKPGTP